MDPFKKADRAIGKIDPHDLPTVKIGDILSVGTVNFSVSGIKKARRGYAISLRSEEGFEWIFPSIKWIGRND